MDIPPEHEAALQTWLENTPGGIIMLMDILFHEECSPNECSISSLLGLQGQLDDLKKLMNDVLKK